MSTLLLRLAGPLQAWGASSKFDTRLTNRWPTKSGVIGMVAAAMGRSREDPLGDLASLRYGVRIDQEGELLKDFHMARHPDKKTLSYVTTRYYLTDASFLVGLEGDSDLLEAADAAIRNPAYPLFLGRRSCPPVGPVSLGIREGSLAESLEKEPWLASEWYMRRMPGTVELEVIHDSAPDEASSFIIDQPISFSQNHRRHGRRAISHSRGVVMQNAHSKRAGKAGISTNLDAIAELKGVDE